MLSERQLLVLKAIVEEYVRTAEPVGSKALLDIPELGFSCSSATIRNDMAYLEALGLIQKTHTSSGRIPSEEGYRVYVKLIMNEKRHNYQDANFPLIDEIMNHSASRERAIRESMSLVTDLTNYASIVMGPSGYNARIKKLQFVSLNGKYAVILMVTDKGNVESKKIIVPESISASEMEKVVNLLNELLYNKTISEIETVIRESFENEEIHDFLRYYDEVVAVFVKAFTNMAKDQFYLSGQNKILTQPEFQNIGKIQDLFDAIERQEVIKAVNVDEMGISVRIGQDNKITAMKDCTVITIPYDAGDGDYGAIALFGPTRMEYQKVIPLLEYIAKNIKKVM